MVFVLTFIILCMLGFLISNEKAKDVVLLIKLFLVFLLIICIFSVFYYINRDDLKITNQIATGAMIDRYRNTSGKYSLFHLKTNLVDDNKIQKILDLDYSTESVLICNRSKGLIIDVNAMPKDKYGNQISYHFDGDVYKIVRYHDIIIKMNNSFIDKIGYEWAAYYIEMLLSNNYNRYDIEEISDVTLFRNGNSRIKEVKYKYIILHVSGENNKDVQLILLINDKDFQDNIINNVDLDLSEKNLYKINDLSYILPYCVNYLDYQYDVAMKVKNTKPSIWDCLYFSTITITSTGYGDILPNSETIRVAVILEVISGIIVIGLFLSALYDKLSWIKPER